VTTGAQGPDDGGASADGGLGVPGSPRVPVVPVVSGTDADRLPAGAPARDPWRALREHTPARIALGRSGVALPTHELLRFAAAHAMARDAVHVPLDVDALDALLREAGWQPLRVVSRAASRDEYLRRPDLGRRLAPGDADRLDAAAHAPCDLAVVIGDGLSAVAVQRHAPVLLQALFDALQPCPGPLQPAPLRWAPPVIATQARVALADEIGARLQARAALILIGERPGLSAPDSLGAYLTFGPRIGRVDAERNCVSNIRPAGLEPAAAARRLAWLLREALRRGHRGVGLKDDSATALLAGNVADGRINGTAGPDD
jgi:ethanolamine ammonia-lyase small subunit